MIVILSHDVSPFDEDNARNVASNTSGGTTVKSLPLTVGHKNVVLVYIFTLLYEICTTLPDLLFDTALKVTTRLHSRSPSRLLISAHTCTFSGPSSLAE